MSSEEFQRSIIIVATVLLAPLIGWVLYHFSRRTSQTQFQPGAASSAARTTTDPNTFTPLITAQLKQLPGTQQQREQVARSVSDLMSRSLDQRVHTVKQEMKEQYEHVIEEKRRSETILQQKFQEVLTEKKQTTSVLESIAEGLVVINNKGEVVMMNPAAERLLAVKSQDRIGRPLMEQQSDEQLIALVQRDNENREIVLNAKQDSTKRVLRASNAVINDEDGKTVGMVSVLSDVTKQRELDQLKADFLAKVSHELRNPLVAMRHALLILSDRVAGPITEEQLKFVTLVQNNLEQLNQLINDLLDLGKLEAQKEDLKLERAALGPVIDGVCESFEAWAKSKSITLGKRVSELPLLPFDQRRVRQVLVNLIGNAIKFTPNQGRVIVEARTVPASGAIEVSVSDNGVAISTADLPKLFNKFQQVGERAATDMGGTGLGLAIAKEIVELHHGRIWAESDGQQGARFAFLLPLNPPGAS